MKPLDPSTIRYRRKVVARSVEAGQGRQCDGRHPRLLGGGSQTQWLLADFLELVVKEQYRVFAKRLTYQMWDDFVADCQNRDAELPAWSVSPIERLRSSVIQILEQAGYIDSTKSLRLQTVHIADEVMGCLKNHDEDIVLRCIEIAT